MYMLAGHGVCHVHILAVVSWVGEVQPGRYVVACTNYVFDLFADRL